MKQIRFWYNANRKTIWKIVGIVVATIIVLQLVQDIWKQRITAEGQTIQNTNNTSDEKALLNSITLQDDESVISGEKISNGQVSFLKTLDAFVDYCNNNKVNEAYNLLSEECKQQMYPTVESFKNSYYNTIFSGKKRSISVENWIGNTYKVKYMEDALATGIYSEGNTVQDYVTLTTDEKEVVKLNINNFLGKQRLDVEKSVFSVNVKVIEKYQYMDYEIYTFEVTNNSDNVILINSANNVESMYLEDSNGRKYPAYTHEIAEAELKVGIRETKKISIKYYNRYSSSRNIKNIIFNKVILNYHAYLNYQNPGYYREYGMIQISL